MAKVIKIMMDQGLLAMMGLCAARRVSTWIRFATQFGTPVVIPGDEGFQGREEDVFLDRLPPLSSSTSAYQRFLRRRENMHNMDCVGTELADGGALIRAAGNVVSSGDMGVYSPGSGTRVRFPLSPDAEMVSWQERPFRARES